MIGLNRRSFFRALLLFATIFCAQQLYWPLKALLAQRLLQQAWQQSLSQTSSSPLRPWPWADTFPVAHISIPRLGVEHVVLADASGHSLAFGPGMVTPELLPGDPGTSVIAAHRDTHFENLWQLSAGDSIRVQRLDGRRFEFVVVSISKLQTPLLVTQSDAASTLELVTCVPPKQPAATRNQRYLVSARLKYPTAAYTTR